MMTPGKAKDPFAGWRGGVSRQSEPFGFGCWVNVIIQPFQIFGIPETLGHFGLIGGRG